MDWPSECKNVVYDLSVQNIWKSWCNYVENLCRKCTEKLVVRVGLENCVKGNGEKH